MSASSGVGLSYIWYKYSNPINGATTSTYQATTTGSYKVQVTNSNGCSKKSNAIVVTVLPAPVATITPNTDTGFCLGDSVLLTSSTGVGYTYQWKRYGNSIAGATSQSYYASIAGTYKVTATSSNGCTKNSPTINVFGPSIANITANGSTSICPSDSVELYVTYNSSFTYQWKFNGSLINNSNFNNIWVKDSGFYSVEISTFYGCASNSNAIYISHYFCGSSNFQTKTLGSTEDMGINIITNNVNEYIIGGLTNNRYSNFLMLKYDSYGNLLWNKSFARHGQAPGARVVQADDGGYFLVGNAQSYSPGNSAALVIKTDSDGNFEWSKLMNGTDNDYGYNGISDNKNGLIFIGDTRSYGNGSQDGYVCSVDSNGVTNWCKFYGGTNIDNFESIQKSLNGGYNLCGATYSFGAGDRDIYMIITDTIGNIIFSKTYGSSGWEFGRKAIVTEDGNILILGGTNVSGAGAMEIILMKVNAFGNILWSKTYGTIHPDIPLDIIESSNNCYTVIGRTGISALNTLFFKIDSIETLCKSLKSIAIK
ncbi:MAG: hypothetical protein IPP34_13495 [Bacteroidetes bacterium]|nr:hypothetical protein [Bacteroidota bacterium]